MRSVFYVLATLIALSSSAAAVTIDTVLVGNAGNSADSTGYGAVPYEYRIGRYEVTNSQYAEFLNAKAASDPLDLFHASTPRYGIIRSGGSGSYTYSVAPNMGDKPVTFIMIYSAYRFANWMNNGQGNGDTESGAYTLLGGTWYPTNAASITRNPGATWFLPSEDEWYKAAYHQPAAQGGDVDDYWLYPTSSNSRPTNALANSVGDISNPGVNVTNYASSGSWNGQYGNVTTVGSAGPLSQSYYGTSDQGGNVFEWSTASKRPWVLRGGSYDLRAEDQWSTQRRDYLISEGTQVIGFRMATIPEPSSIVLAVLGVAGITFMRRRWITLCSVEIIGRGVERGGPRWFS